MFEHLEIRQRVQTGWCKGLENAKAFEWQLNRAFASQITRTNEVAKEPKDYPLPDLLSDFPVFGFNSHTRMRARMKFQDALTPIDTVSRVHVTPPHADNIFRLAARVHSGRGRPAANCKNCAWLTSSAVWQFLTADHPRRLTVLPD